MKHNILNKASTDLMLALIDLLGEKDSIKIDNNKPGSGIMALCMEKRNTIVHPTWPDCPAMIYSLAHYYEQNGDLMADPLMEFIVVDGRQMRTEYMLKNELSETLMQVVDKKIGVSWVRVQPSYFQQDGILATYQESVVFEDGKVKGYRLKWLKDHITFANGWFKNIQWQQEIDVKKVSSSKSV